MKILEINGTDLFSTGNIMLNIAKVARSRGHEVITASKYCKMSIDRQRNDPNHIYIGNRLGNTIHRYWAWMTDLQDTGSYFSTKRFIHRIEKFNPDVVHLHDILGWYLNIDVLFNYLKKKSLPVVWTFHDCWAFTGRCIYFDEVKCERWKTGCGQCPQKHYMPRTWWFDLSKWNYKRKKRLFTSIHNLTIVTPSQWLADLTKESFFKNFPIRVINNGINLDDFKYTQGIVFDKLKSDRKKIVLAVAGTWSKRKGLGEIIRLSEELPDDYKIVVVGLAKSNLPNSSKIEAINRTHDIIELAEIYSAADVLVNPTFEDNFPTVNLEALACGIPVVTYRTGGSPESITTDVGIVVKQGDFRALKESVIHVCEQKDRYSASNCILRSKLYNMEERFNDYVDVLETVSQA